MSEPTFKPGDRVRIKDDAFSDTSKYAAYRGTTAQIANTGDRAVAIWIKDESSLLWVICWKTEIELLTDAND